MEFDYVLNFNNPVLLLYKIIFVIMLINTNSKVFKINIKQPFDIFLL